MTEATRKMRTTLDFSGQGTTTGLRAPVQPTDAATRKFVVDTVSDVTGVTPASEVDPGDLTLIFDNKLV
jgi:hypothetical protein